MSSPQAQVEASWRALELTDVSAIARHGVHWAADLFLLRGEISRGGGALLTEARLPEEGTTVSASVSMVSSPIGSARAALGVS